MARPHQGVPGAHGTLPAGSDTPGWASFPRIFRRWPTLRICFIPTREGLYLNAGFTHRLGRQPLLVPWRAVHIEPQEKSGDGRVDLLLGDDDAVMMLRVKEGFGRRLALWKSRAAR